jgi:hypothetical protein
MGLRVLHGGEELGSAGELTRGLLAPYPSVVLAPLARRAAEWRSVADEARRVLERPVRLAHPAHPSVELSEGDAVFIPGGDPALAARQVTPALRAALEGRYVVAASAGAMMLGEEMVSGCPDGCGSLSSFPAWASWKA